MMLLLALMEDMITMPKKLLMSLILVCQLMVTSAICQADTKQNGVWQVWTQDTKIEFSMRDGWPVVSALRAVGGEKPHNWVMESREAVLPAEIEIDGKVIPLKWRFLKEIVVVRERNEVAFEYINDNPKLVLISVWKGFKSPGPIEHQVILEVRSKAKQVTITPVPTIDLRLSAPGAGKLENWWVEKGAGSPPRGGTHVDSVEAGYSKCLFSGPYSTDDTNRDAIPWFCLHSPAENQGIYGGIEFSGWTQIQIARLHGKTIAVDLGVRRDKPTRLLVDQEKGIAFPPCFIGAYSGDVDDGCNKLHRWVEEYLRPPMPGGVTPLLVNNSWGSGMSVDEALAKRMIDDCARLGIEVYHVDAGWYREVGDWYSHPEKIPNGLEKIADYAHSKGLKFGLWVGWTQGGSSGESNPSVLSVFNPRMRNWFGEDMPADWKNRPFTGLTVCLACKDAWDWCLAELRRMVQQYKLDLLEHDQRIILENCTRADHGHVANDPIDVSRACAEGYYKLYDILRGEYPSLILEDCVNGGRMVDFGVAKRVHYICATDVYDPISLRKAFYDASYPLPPSMIEGYIENRTGNTIANFKYMLRSAMLGWATIMIDTTQWSEEQHQIAKREFDLYKSELRPLIAKGDLYHILPRPVASKWDGIQYFDPKRGKGVVYVFRANSELETQTIRLRGLDAHKQYQVCGEDGSVMEGVVSGQTLISKGISVHLPEKDSSDLIFLVETKR